ncbi:hypothetical protein [Chryseolinea lacunae]|uniref:Uncharacterized protein n=1 Tax=Chryseolinea lacunae TaxID=2801331 RepID=A0ABS1KU29_9BACT|nr:hypothetical protein [Chryseolinea lacunae]MBL0742966.1 hypothetical protein [Chryseolinea lacunae]
MKRFLSIVLLSVFLFNVIGYHPMFWALRYQARMEMAQRLDSETYTADETITIKVPLAVPYNTFNPDYERATGTFEHHGEFFTLVKQKLAMDTLYVVCIKDHKERQLHAAMTDFIKLSCDIPSASQKTLKLLSGLIKDYLPASPSLPTSQHHSVAMLFGTVIHTNLSTRDLPVLTPPPDLLA